jgi:phage gpG-like protein
MPPGALSVLRGRFERPELAMRAAGALLVGKAQRSFRAQRRGRVQWPERGAPNVAGILSDMNAGREPPSRRFEARPALIDTGNLRRSIHFIVSGPDRITLIASATYASQHERGGTSTQPVTRAAIRNLTDFLRRRRDLRPRLGFLFNLYRTGQPLRTNIPRRPFLMPTAEDLAEARRVVRRILMGGG